jgi:hypothetical protein
MAAKSALRSGSRIVRSPLSALRPSTSVMPQLRAKSEHRSNRPLHPACTAGPVRCCAAARHKRPKAAVLPLISSRPLRTAVSVARLLRARSQKRTSSKTGLRVRYRWEAALRLSSESGISGWRFVPMRRSVASSRLLPIQVWKTMSCADQEITAPAETCERALHFGAWRRPHQMIRANLG